MHNVISEVGEKLDHLISHAHTIMQQNDLIIELLRGSDKAVIDELTNTIKLARTKLSNAIAKDSK